MKSNMSQKHKNKQELFQTNKLILIIKNCERKEYCQIIPKMLQKDKSHPFYPERESERKKKDYVQNLSGQSYNYHLLMNF